MVRGNVRFLSVLSFQAVSQFLAHHAHDALMNIFMNSRAEYWICALASPNQRSPEWSFPVLVSLVELDVAVCIPWIDTLRRMLCLFSQQSCLMLFAYQGDQHGSDNTCLTQPAFFHQHVDLLSHLLFSARQFMSLSMNGVNNSHQYLI